MKVFLNIEKAQELFRQYEQEHRGGNQPARGGGRGRERSIKIVGERRANPPPLHVVGGYNLRGLI